jgi:hypothetical protein
VVVASLAVLVFTGCTSSLSDPPERTPVNLTGHWEGAWVPFQGGQFYSGDVRLDLQQDAGRVTGTILWTRAQSQKGRGAPIEGTVSGQTFTFDVTGMPGVIGDFLADGDRLDGRLSGWEYALHMSLGRKRP